MKRIIAILAVILCCVAATAQQNANPEFVRLIQEDLTRAAVNMNSYEFNPIVDTPAPKGYKPFYISHYGRHGSRSNWGDAHYKSVISVLTQARQQGILTAEGEALLGEAQAVLDGYDGMDGRLTPRGVREHRQIAERMYRRFPDVFRKGSKNVVVNCSTSQRCIISMASFTNSLTACQPDLHWSFDTGEKIYAYISSDRSSAQKKKEQEMLAPIYAAPTDTTWVLGHLFTDPVAGKALIKDINAFQNDIWETAAIAECFDVPGQVFRHLPSDVVYKYWDALNRLFYLGHCNSVEFGPDRMERGRPLVDDVLRRADAAIADGSVCADLRFGHDYGLLALASYLGIEGVGDRLSFDEIPQKWFGASLICMASNLQIVFYKNRKGHVLVKFVYNEKECPLRGLEPVSGPYYDWETVRADIAGYKR